MNKLDLANYDVFVSYAHADNETGWVETLVKLMKTKVKEALGREPRVFFDPQIKIGTEVPEELVGSVSASGILLVILSPSYLGSEWCRDELRHFLAARQTKKQNVFVVEAEKVSRTKWYSELVNLETREFWDNTDGKPPFRLDPKLGPDVEARFTRNAHEIGYAVAERLQTLEPVAAPPSSKGTVWIAPVTDDLRQQRRDLAEMVKQANWTVLPASPYKRDDQNAFTEALEKDLSEAKLFVQLLGPWSGENPDWSEFSFPELQAYAARDAAKLRRVPWLLWRTKTALATEDSRSYHALVGDGSVQEGTPGEFSGEVLRTLKGLSDPKPKRERPKVVKGDDNGETPVTLYIRNADQDKELVENIQASLVTMNVDIITPAPSVGPSPGDRREAEAPTRECDGALLVHGETSASWVQSQYIHLRKTLRPNRLIGLYKAPPPPKQDLIVSRALYPVECQEGFDVERLKAFIDHVRQQQNDKDDDDA